MDHPETWGNHPMLGRNNQWFRGSDSILWPQNLAQLTASKPRLVLLPQLGIGVAGAGDVRHLKPRTRPAGNSPAGAWSLGFGVSTPQKNGWSWTHFSRVRRRLQGRVEWIPPPCAGTILWSGAENERETTLKMPPPSPPWRDKPMYLSEFLGLVSNGYKRF